MKASPKPRASAGGKESVESLKREVDRLKASLLLHDRMGRLQLGTARQWQAIFDALSLPMALMDANGNIVQANRAMTEIAGKPCLEVVGSACWLTLHDSKARIEDCLFLEMKKAGKSISSEREGCGYRMKVHLDPIFDEKGKLTGAVHTVTSLTPLNGGSKRRKTTKK